MISGWMAIAALALAAFAAAVLVLRLPREGFGIFGAALVFGLAGYAWQGSPGQPSAPKSETAIADNQGEAMVEGRAALFAGTQPPSAYQLTSDAFARRGRFADAAAILQKGLRDNPQDQQGWLALGLALVGHADGIVTPAAVEAFGRAQAIDPAHPGAEYFLGYAYLQSGEIRAARNVWAGLLERSPPEAPWVEGLSAEVARLDDMIARAPMLQGR
ncbi:tetratricopeptide repeat protein [Porphyrobacter sp. LM 6]|jgi:cytochrome c-type biogenesis protein CcmH|uniref:tetratricopeptide repeat protein n=1 Tax=Porphyrobacter sp. LM 6 TaxID=1896196 RepID=UPI000846608E|nr:tetratricopeptide repeat protein [Porphyrobacter sp. LM 6]AOL94532.1 cytochrome c-type biogenesis protein CcmH [Porphyrobacter sp. LM 6]